MRVVELGQLYKNMVQYSICHLAVILSEIHSVTVVKFGGIDNIIKALLNNQSRFSENFSHFGLK